MSTAGLQAPSVKGVGEDRYLEDFPALFVFFFSMTGVPIFGLALGQLGGLLVDHHIAAKERESMAKLLTKDEFDSVSGLDYGAGDEGKRAFEGDSSEDYAGPRTGGYFQLDSEGRPVSRRGKRLD